MQLVERHVAEVPDRVGAAPVGEKDDYVTRAMRNVSPYLRPRAHVVNPAGFVIHGAIHAARQDAMCVLHTHTLAGCAVAASASGLLPVNQISMEFFDRVGYHDYEGVALNLDEQKRLVADLGAHDALILRNHGLLTVGATPARACATSTATARSAR